MKNKANQPPRIVSELSGSFSSFKQYQASVSKAYSKKEIKRNLLLTFLIAAKYKSIARKRLGRKLRSFA